MSEKISQYLKEKNCQLFFTCFYGTQVSWGPVYDNCSLFKKGKIAENLRAKSLKYLKKHSLIDYCGPVLLENISELQDFLKNLLAFPAVFSYRDIFVFCLGLPLVMELSHHLDIRVYTSSKEVYTNLKEFACKNELTYSEAFQKK